MCEGTVVRLDYNVVGEDCYIAAQTEEQGKALISEWNKRRRDLPPITIEGVFHGVTLEQLERAKGEPLRTHVDAGIQIWF